MTTQTFKFDTTDITLRIVDETPWFLASDIAKALGIKNVSMMVKNADLDENEKGIIANDTFQGEQKMLFLSETGVYGILMSSTKPATKKFRNWLKNNVLPSIRKTGSYTTPGTQKQLPEDYEIRIMEARANILQQVNALAKTAAEFDDKGYTKFSATLRAGISNEIIRLNGITNQQSNVNALPGQSDIIDVEQNNSIVNEIPEGVIDVAIRLGYQVPQRFHSALGRYVKSQCADLVCGSNKRYTATQTKIESFTYPPFNERVEQGVIEYCEKKGINRKVIKLMG